MATCHGAEVPHADGDAALLIDIDLSILGAPPEIFDRYDTAIREEYSWVPEVMYTAGRAKVLRLFLERDVIFTTPSFRDEREEQARANLTRALDALTALIAP